MPRRKTIKNEARDYFQAAVYSTIAMEIGFVACNYYFDAGWDLLLPPSVAFGGMATLRALDGVWTKSPVSISSGYKRQGMALKINDRKTFSSVLDLIGFRLKDKPPGQRTMKYKEPERGEFFWEVSLSNRDLPIRIYESRLFGLVKTANRRQRLGERAPFSREYFTRLYTPRFRFVQYQACMELLKSCGLVEDREQGASGRLIYPPYATIEFAKESFSPLPT